jgi:hypothetical protein
MKDEDKTKGQRITEFVAMRRSTELDALETEEHKRVGEALQENRDQPLFLDWGWYIFLAILLILGALLVWLQPAFPEWVKRMSPRVRSDGWANLVAILLFSIVGTHLVIFYAMRFLHRLLSLRGSDTKADLYSPAFVGICESLLYPIVMMIGKDSFIGVWLALKVAAQWIRWRGEDGRGPRDVRMENEGRRRFNRFLIGNGLSVLLGGLTYLFIKSFALDT